MLGLYWGPFFAGRYYLGHQLPHLALVRAHLLRGIPRSGLVKKPMMVSICVEKLYQDRWTSFMV